MEAVDSSRVRVACEMCRKRKRKCDGVQPICHGCRSRDVECRYSLSKAPRQKRDPGYVIGLEDQIELLKDELNRLKNLGPEFKDIPQLQHGNLSQNCITGQDEASAACGKISRKSTPIQDISSMIWRMSIEDSGEPAFIGPSGNACFPTAQRTLPEDKLDPQKLTMKSPVVPTDPSNPETLITNRLLDLFVELINPFHYFVCQNALGQLRAEDIKPDLSLVKHAAMAAASILDDDEDSRAFGNDAASAVESVLLPACRQYPSIPLVQALAIMCWRELGLENYNMAWMYNSMCASMTLHLGLPVSSLHALERPTNGDDRAGIAAAWSALLIDRLATRP
ncbi:hypothetical protein PENANT_c035G09900 [Penicillium antarcticum]|uniref:Zn(2)-C6 fungal-type domain-containing protein n=1 Tax=Penicillium antarcticum TaxID=416450 RepID=A0A1V6PU80_9EURO|nr:hypothetical protein PENANT_c035G09900 [Penicillium antarcticum]